MISRTALVTGYRLAGLSVITAEDARGAAAALVTIAAEKDVGIVLVDEELHRRLPRQLMRRLDRQALPLVVPVPAPRRDTRSGAEAYILEILR